MSYAPNTNNKLITVGFRKYVWPFLPPGIQGLLCKWMSEFLDDYKYKTLNNF